MHRTHALVFALLVGCIGGQTGDDRGGGAAPPPDPFQCRKNGIVIELDKELPLGYSARDLMESVPAEAHTEGVIWPAAEIELADETNAWGGQPAESMRVVLRSQLNPVEHVELYQGDCAWQGDFALSGTLEIEAEGASIGRKVFGYFSGAPGHVFFNERRPPVVGSSLCTRAVQVSFVEDALPAGVICDAEHNALTFPSACGGVPSAGEAWIEGPTPREVLEAFDDHGPLHVVWADSQRAPISIALELVPDSACYRVSSWVAQVRMRASAPSAGLEIDEIVALRASADVEDERSATRSIGAACAAVAPENVALRVTAGLGDAPGLLCVEVDLDEDADVPGRVTWDGSADEDAGTERMMDWVIVEDAP